MPRTRTRSEIEASARIMADVNDQYMADAALNYEYDQSVADLWNLLVAADSERYSTTTTITTVSGTTAYTVPADFMAIVSLNLMRGTERVWVDRFDEQTRTFGHAITSHGYPTARYRIVGQGVDGTDTRLEFDVDPGADTYEMRYVQAPPTTSLGADAFDGVAGFEQWVALDLAIKMRIREESDPQMLMIERKRIEDRIRLMGRNRDMGRPKYIKRTRWLRRRRL